MKQSSQIVEGDKRISKHSLLRWGTETIHQKARSRFKGFKVSRKRTSSRKTG